MKYTLTAIALLFALGTASAGPNFVDSNTALPGTKVDKIAPKDPTHQWTAADANFVFNALDNIRTVLQRAPVNAKAFGAKGDGTCVSTPCGDGAAIQSALNAAAVTTNGAFGGAVLLPKGVYVIDQPLVVPSGVGLQGDNPANTIIRLKSGAAIAAAIVNTNQTGGQEFAFLDALQVDCNAPGGATVSEACVSWGSLFINSYIRNVIVMRSSSVGLHVFAKGSPGGTGPVLIENTWAVNNTTHGVLVEDDATNSGAFAGIVFVNLTSEHQGSNSSAIYLKGNGHAGQVNFYNTHIEMGPGLLGSEVHRVGITIDGFPDVNFTGVQIQTGNNATIDAGIKITNVAANLRIQIRGVTNINSINPILSDLKNSVTYAAVHLPHYLTPDITYNALQVFPLNGKSINVQDSSGTSRAWFDNNGRVTGAGPFGGGLEIVANPQGTPGSSDDRAWLVMDHNVANPFGLYYPNGGGGAIRERMFNSGSDVRQVGTNGTVFWYQAQTYQGSVTLQSSLIGSQSGGTTCPSSGTHTQGEIVFFASPTAGGNIGCVCTTGGSPGTWKTWGAVAP